LANSAYAAGERPVWKAVWQLPIPQKVKIFIWRAIVQGLATRDNKFQRKLEKTNICQLCDRWPETAHHALIECPHAVYLWNDMMDYWDLPTMEQR